MNVDSKRLIIQKIRRMNWFKAIFDGIWTVTFVLNGIMWFYLRVSWSRATARGHLQPNQRIGCKSLDKLSLLCYHQVFQSVEQSGIFWNEFPEVFFSSSEIWNPKSREGVVMR
jgi:hypothetical protein